MAKIDSRVGKACISVESRQDAIAEINRELEELAIIHESIVPFDPLPSPGELRLVPGFCIGHFLWGRSIAIDGKVPDGKEMGAQ
jgi:hypothetical protein